MFQQECLEPAILPDVFFTTIGAIRDIGNGLVRISLCVETDDGLVVVAKLVTPVAAALAHREMVTGVYKAIHQKNNRLRLVR